MLTAFDEYCILMKPGEADPIYPLLCVNKVECYVFIYRVWAVSSEVNKIRCENCSRWKVTGNDCVLEKVTTIVIIKGKFIISINISI